MSNNNPTDVLRSLDELTQEIARKLLDYKDTFNKIREKTMELVDILDKIKDEEMLELFTAEAITIILSNSRLRLFEILGIIEGVKNMLQTMASIMSPVSLELVSSYMKEFEDNK